MDDLSANSSVPRLVELPIDVQSAVRSGKTINCAAQAVEELVLNAIDAEATKILVGVDFDIFRVQVDDNGNGIRKNDLVQIGTRHSTSKCHSLEDLNNIRSYGFRGESLASIIDISEDVKLFTRPKLDEYCYTKKFTHGKDNGTIIESPGIDRKTNGLSISLVNFMGKFQVQQNRIDHSIELEEIKAVLERILLINPHVALVFTNDTTGAQILNISSSLTVAFAFRKIFIESKGRMASLEHLLESHFAHGSFFFKIYVSKASHRSKNLQLVYVNKRYIARGKIHRTLNQGFSNLFGFEVRKTGNETKKEDKKKSSSVGFKFESRSLKKYPVFILNIDCPPNLYDITSDPKKTVVEFRSWNLVMEGLEGLMDRVKISIKTSNTNIVVAKHFGQSKLDQNQCIEPVATTSKAGCKDSRNLENVGKNITTHSMRRAVHSRVAGRGGGEEDPELDNNTDGAQRTYGQSISMSRESQHPSDDDVCEMSKDDDDSSKLKALENQKRSKLQLSTVSRKKTRVDIKSLRRKRKNTFDDSTIHSKRHQALAEKSSRPLGVGFPKIMSEKFPPWRLKFEGRETESLDRKKLVPWRVNSQKRKSDELSDQLSRLNMSNSDTDSSSPSRDEARPRISRPRKRVKNLKRSSVAQKRRRTTLEESDADTGNNLEDVEMSQNAKWSKNREKGTGFSQNKMNIPMSQSQEFGKISDSSSSSGDRGSGLVGNRHCLNVISGELESVAALLGIEDYDSYAMSLPLRHRTAFYTGILPQGNENEAYVTETGRSPDMFASYPVNPSVESPAPTGQASITDNEVGEINANVTVVAETPPTNRWSPWMELGVGVEDSLNTNVRPSEATCPVLNSTSLEEMHGRRGLGADPTQCFPPPPPKKKTEEKFETQDKFQVERKQFKELVNTAIFVNLIGGERNSDKYSDIEKWVNSTIEHQHRKQASSTLLNDNSRRGKQKCVLDRNQQSKGKKGNERSAIEDSQSLSPPRHQISEEENNEYLGLERSFQLPEDDPKPIGESEMVGPAVIVQRIRPHRILKFHHYDFIQPIPPPPLRPSKVSRRVLAETAPDPAPAYFTAKPTRGSDNEESQDDVNFQIQSPQNLENSQDLIGTAIVPPSPQEMTMTSIPGGGQGHLDFSPAFEMEMEDDENDEEADKNPGQVEPETSPK